MCCGLYGAVLIKRYLKLQTVELTGIIQNECYKQVISIFSQIFIESISCREDFSRKASPCKLKLGNCEDT